MSSERPAPRPDDDPTVLPGIGPRTAATLAEAGVHTVFDLLLHLPLRYEDRSHEAPVATPGRPGDRVLVRGRLDRVSRVRVRRRLDIVRAELRSEDGACLPVAWFNQGWMEERARAAGSVRLWGVLRSRRGGGLELVNPELSEVEDRDVVPVYRRLGPLTGRRLRGVVHAAIRCLDGFEDPLGPDEPAASGVTGLGSALRTLHEPTLDGLDEHLDRARERLAFDELMRLAVRASIRRHEVATLESPRLVVDDARWRMMVRSLPFELTAAQQRVLREIRDDLARGRPMARLLQGDVGCGKTVVAALAMALVVEGGMQTAFMAPTETLALQHARSLHQLLEPLGVPLATLVGSLAPAAARQVRRDIASGAVQAVVGTHALVQESVEFARLGLAVVDEQHRFGVLQRQALVNKGERAHLLVMTATPIPRSLALVVHGDLELSVIDEIPPGRAQVRTVVRTPDARPKLLAFLRREIQDGGRVFWVFPVIEGSEANEIPALLEHETRLRADLAPARVGVVHGRLSTSEREAASEAFRRGDLDVLLATTVVEVGLDVPAASVMVIEGAERFGLSQLHQLRGRVGRGTRPSWCVALTGAPCSDRARLRLELFREVDDGFRLADADLELRGPGEIEGVQQWGHRGFRFVDLSRDGALLTRARETVARLERDGRLAKVARVLDTLYGAVGARG